MAGIEDEFGDEFFGDDDYIYAEDAYDAADELAEHALPSPPYYGDDDDDDDFDPYDYFADLEYNSDGYDDEKIISMNGRGRGVKRKKPSNDEQAQGRKVVKTGHSSSPRNGSGDAASQTPSPPATTVLWRARGRKETNVKSLSDPSRTARKSFALLKDWRERCRNTPGLIGLSREPKSQPDDDKVKDQRHDSVLSEMLSSQTLADLQTLISRSDGEGIDVSEALQKIISPHLPICESNEMDGNDGLASLSELVQVSRNLHQGCESRADPFQLDGALDREERSVPSTAGEGSKVICSKPKVSSPVGPGLVTRRLRSQSSTPPPMSTSSGMGVTAAGAPIEVESRQKTKTVIEVRIPVRTDEANGNSRPVVPDVTSSKRTKQVRFTKETKPQSVVAPRGPPSSAIPPACPSKKRKAENGGTDEIEEPRNEKSEEGNTHRKRRRLNFEAVDSHDHSVRGTRSGRVWRS